MPYSNVIFIGVLGGICFVAGIAVGLRTGKEIVQGSLDIYKKYYEKSNKMNKKLASKLDRVQAILEED